MAGFIVMSLLIGISLFCFRMIEMPVNNNDHIPDINKCESPIERRVYNGLVQHGLYPNPQFKVGRYRIDLAFPYQKIAIECDGKAFHSSPGEKRHDKKRDEYLRSEGWIVLRFSGRKINRDLPGVVNKIKENIK